MTSSVTPIAPASLATRLAARERVLVREHDAEKDREELRRSWIEFPEFERDGYREGAPSSSTMLR
jgi:hypothetical protein